MEQKIIYRPQIYLFYHFLQRNDLIPDGEKCILDCGAGGLQPPLGLFYEQGFTTHGIEISAEQLARATTFQENHKMPLNIQFGDMRAIPFPDGSFNFVYELYAMVHLSKSDIRQTMGEMRRVLKPGGVCFLSFMLNEEGFSRYSASALGEVALKEGEHKVNHSIYTEEEAFDACHGWEWLHVDKQYYMDTSKMRERGEEISAANPTWEFGHIFFILRK